MNLAIHTAPIGKRIRFFCNRQFVGFDEIRTF